MTPLAPHITAFLRERLPVERGASQHTCDTYAYAFQLLFDFAARRLRTAPSALHVEQLDAGLVRQFLEHLESDRRNGPSTRNARLAAIKSFMRFLEHRIPSALEQIRSVLAIPTKKTDSPLVAYLTSEETRRVLDAPAPTTRLGIRDRAMLQLAIATGLRVSELIGLRVEDLVLQPQPSIRVRGKGRKERALPLWKETAAALRAWLAVRGAVPVPELFTNARGAAMTRSGFEYILDKHVAAASQHCQSLLDKSISPHSLRHTCAMVALQATHNICKVSLWLGHASVQTTEIYTRANPADKLEAMEAVAPPALKRGHFRPPDRLIAELKRSSKAPGLCGVDSPRGRGPDAPQPADST